MNLIDTVKGYVVIEISGLGLERFINICHSRNIYLRKMTAKKAYSICTINLKDFKKMREPRRISGVRIRILKKKGLPFFMNKNRKRQFAVVGILLFFFVNLMLARYLWKIDIEGNSYYSDSVIIEYLKTIDVKYGTKLTDISCYEIEASLRQNFEQIIWVSADIKGSRLSIVIKENQDTVFEQISDNEYDIAAAKSGTIHSIITRRGTPIIKAGDEVVAGDVLVMSKVESANESGEVFATEYVHADADILINTSYEYSDILSRTYDKKEYTGRVMEVTGIKIGEKTMYTGITKCKYELYDTYTDYSTISPYDNMFFPATYIFTYHKEYTLKEAQYTDEELSELLAERLENYLKELEERDIEITAENVSIEVNEDGARAVGSINVIESAITLQKPVKEIVQNEENTEN